MVGSGALTETFFKECSSTNLDTLSYLLSSIGGTVLKDIKPRQIPKLSLNPSQSALRYELTVQWYAHLYTSLQDEKKQFKSQDYDMADDHHGQACE